MDLYSNYERNYIKKENSEQLNTWQIMANRLKSFWRLASIYSENKMKNSLDIVGKNREVLVEIVLFFRLIGALR